MAVTPGSKLTSRPFSVFSGATQARWPTLTLPGKAAPQPVVAKTPGAPKASTPKAVTKPTTPSAKPKPPAPPVAAPKPPEPKPAPATQPPNDDPLIIARMAALVAARREWPEVFNDDFPPLPTDISIRLKELVGDGRAAQAALDWWCRQPGFRRARKARRRVSVPPAEACAETLTLVQSFAPDLFDPAAPKPLAIGIHQQLAARGIAPEAANALLRYWTRQPAYRRAVAAGGFRYNLDGTEAGSISEEHQKQATNPGSRQ